MFFYLLYTLVTFRNRLKHQYSLNLYFILILLLLISKHFYITPNLLSFNYIK